MSLAAHPQIANDPTHRSKVPFAQPEPLRRELAQALPDRPFALRFWDGSELAPTDPGGPVFTVRSPAAVAHLLRAPGQLGLGRAYAAGELEADDLDLVIGLLDTFKAPAIDTKTRLRLTLAAVRACGLMSRRRSPPASCARAGGATAASATRARCATTTTSRTSSSRCSSTSR